MRTNDFLRAWPFRLGTRQTSSPGENTHPKSPGPPAEATVYAGRITHVCFFQLLPCQPSIRLGLRHRFDFAQRALKIIVADKLLLQLLDEFCNFRDGRKIEKSFDRQFRLKGLMHRRDNVSRRKRMASQIPKIIVNTNLNYRQSLSPNFG